MFLKRTDYFERPGCGKSGGDRPVGGRTDGSRPGGRRAGLDRVEDGRPRAAARAATRRSAEDAELAGALALLRTRAAEQRRADLVSQVDDIASYLEQSRFTVAVVGEFSRGKSSLVNALTSSDLVPTGAVPTTVAPTHVIGGDRDELTAFLGAAERRHPATPEGWDALESELDGAVPDAVLVTSTCPLLADNDLELVDTPGVAVMSANSNILSIADQALAASDGAILTISAASPLSENERSFLEERLVARKVPRIMVVVTMLDLVSDQERGAVMEYLTDGVRNLAPGCPVLVSREGLVEGWEGRCGTHAIEAQLVSWIEESGHRELKLERARVLARTVAQDLADLYAQKLAVLEETRDERERDAERRKRELASAAQISWGSLEVEMLERVDANFRRIGRIADERRADLQERLVLELSHVNNPKDWWERDYPYRVKVELISFGNVLENTLQGYYARDLAWLNQELERLCGRRVASRAAHIAERQVFRGPVEQSELEMEDMAKSRLVSRVGTGVIAVGAATLGSLIGLGPIGLAASVAGGVVSEVSMGKRVEQQRTTLSKAIEHDLPGVYDRCVSAVEKSVRELYRDVIAQTQALCEEQTRARIAAIDEAARAEDPTREAEALRERMRELEGI